MEFPGERHASGLMLASVEEAVELEAALMCNDMDEASLLQFGDDVMDSSARISAVFHHDIRFALHQEFDGELPREEGEAYTNGLYLGYTFVVGYMSLLGFMRSGYDDPEEFIDDLVIDDIEMPAGTPQQMKRVKSFRQGHEPIDIVMLHDYGYDNSAYIAEESTQAYMFESPVFETLIDRMFDLISEQGLEEEEIALSGLHDGVENALEMYIQSREEAILQALDPDNEPANL